MSSIRSRLAVGYAVTLLLTLGGFCAAVYYELRKPSISGLDTQLVGERDLAVQYLSESYRVLGNLVPPGGSPSLAPGVAAGFQGMRDYLLIVDTAGSILYTSDSLAALPFADLQSFTTLLTPPQASNRSVSLRLGERR